MNRREFYVARSGEDLLHVLALVEKKDYSAVLGERLGKDEIMERLDQHPMSSLLLADKLRTDGQPAVEAAPGEAPKEPGKKESSDAVAKALARIGQTVEETVRRLHQPLVNEVQQLTGLMRALDQNKAGKGEMTAAIKASKDELREGVQEESKKVISKLEEIHGEMLDEAGVVELIQKHGVPKEAVREAVLAATEEHFDKLRASVSVAPAVKVETGEKASKAGKPTEAQLKDAAVLKVAGENVRPIKMETVEKVFGVKLTDATGSQLKVELWNDPDAEQINPDYVFNPEHLRIALFAMSKKPARNVFIFGETGTGKTEFVRQLSARLGRRMYRVNFENQADSYNFIGGERAKNASTVYQYGTFTLGLRHPGAIILLDELCFGKPGHLAALHATLEYEGALTIQETGEKIFRAEGVIIFAADNTNGTGDRTGRYDGLYTMNGALRRRFSYWMQFDYPPGELEADIIARKTGTSIKATRIVVDLMKSCRAAARAGTLADAPSLPHAIAFCELVQSGKKTREAYEQTVVMATSPEYAEKLQELYTASFKEEAFEKAL